MKTLTSDHYQSPIGDIVIVADAGRLCYLDFADNSARMEKILRARYGAFNLTAQVMSDARARLDDYFCGDWHAFDDIDISPAGTDFQCQVWRQLRTIPPGEAISYCELAAAVDRPKAVRAAGGANARNPLAIIIPCHRVIAADGSLGGYAGGVARKSWLLEHEKHAGHA